MPRMGKDTFVRIRTPGGAGGYIMAPVLTTTQRNALTGEEGMIIFNSTTDQIEEYDGATWEAVGQVIMTTHAALTIAHGTVDDIADQTDIATHKAVLAAHTYNIGTEPTVGQYFNPFPFGHDGNITMVADRAKVAPLFIARDMTIDYIKIHLVTGIDAKKGRIALYNSNSTPYPSSLKLDCGQFNVAIADQGEIAIDITDTSFTKGLYWFSVVADGAVTFYGHFGNYQSILGWYAGSHAWNYLQNEIFKAAVGIGAPADPLAAGYAPENDYIPAVLFRVKSRD